MGIGLIHIARRRTANASWTALLAAQVGFEPDYVVDPTHEAASDANDGSEAAPWETITKLRTTLAALGTGQSRVAFVRAATYANQNLSVVLPDSTSVTLAFEEGAVIDDNGGTAAGCLNFAGNTAAKPTVVVYGNGLTIQNFAQSSSNACGTTNVNATFRDITTNNCQDGLTCHGNETVLAERCNFLNCTRGAYPIAGSGLTLTANYCNFSNVTGATSLASNTTTSASQTFNHCAFWSNASSGPALNCDIKGAVFNYCQIGSLTRQLNMTQAFTGSQLINCFINILIHLRYGVTINRCYGFMSGLCRTSADGNQPITITNNHFFNGATASADSAIYGSNLGVSPMTIRNNIFENLTTAIGLTFATGDVDAWNANVTLSNNAFFNNTFNFTTTLGTGSTPINQGTGNVTTDPLTGVSNTLVQADYAWADGAGSPCEGAGFGGANIGFSDLDLAA